VQKGVTNFFQWLQILVAPNPDILGTSFSAYKLVPLSEHVNSHDKGVWAAVKPHAIREKSLHPQKVGCDVLCQVALHTAANIDICPDVSKNL
jgi:hypothetical protein